MLRSAFHAPTLREAPNDAELPSHSLLIRAGYIRQLAAGIYNLLPLGVRVVERIKAIIREELNAAGALEVFLSGVQPADLWQESGRWEKYGPELLRLNDRKQNAFCLGPTHEEVIVDLVRRDIRSYKELPMNLYQIQTKFRDELRPRAGLMRGREFLMKDAYSFDVDAEAAAVSYRKMFDAYSAIFTRCGLDFRPVEADTGQIGGSLSHEFQVLADTGEDRIVSCSHCDYAANTELAGIGTDTYDLPAAPPGAPTAVDTPGHRTVEEVTAFLGIAASGLLKTLVVVVDEEPWLAVVRGDRELSIVKVRKALGAEAVDMASDDVVREVTGAPVGFAGPVGLDAKIVVDAEVMAMAEAVVGGNAADVHLRGVVPGHHFTPAEVADIRVAQAGDACPKCGSELNGFRGIEVGHVFHLGTKYAEPMKATFLDHQGKRRPLDMGCYGIGVTRVMAAAVEQHHDERGIVWPLALAPFDVAVVPLGKPGDDADHAARTVYDGLKRLGLDPIYDDRKERAGVKLADVELMGVPFLAVIGRRGLADGVLELKDRHCGVSHAIPLEGAAEAIAARVRGDAA